MSAHQIRLGNGQVVSFDPMFVEHVVTATHSATGTVLRLPAVTVGAVAMEMLIALKDELPGCRLGIVRTRREQQGFPSARQASDRVKAVVIATRDCPRPGRELLRRLGASLLTFLELTALATPGKE